MKLTRKMLLIIVASLGALLIVYSLIREFAGIGFSETIERRAINVVVVAALLLFLYNRKMARNEKQAKEEEEVKRRAEENPVEETEDDSHLPHWERKNYDD